MHTKKSSSRTTYKAKQGARSQWAYWGEQGKHMGEHVSANTSRSKTPLTWKVTVLTLHCHSDSPCTPWNVCNESKTPIKFEKFQCGNGSEPIVLQPKRFQIIRVWCWVRGSGWEGIEDGTREIECGGRKRWFPKPTRCSTNPIPHHFCHLIPSYVHHSLKNPKETNSQHTDCVGKNQ